MILTNVFFCSHCTLVCACLNTNTYLGAGIVQWHSAGLRAGRSGVRFPAGAGNLFLHHRVQTGSGDTQPPIQWVPGALSLEVKRPEGEADYSPPSSAEVKNTWSYTSTPPICLHGVVLS
jgi:hypothetical protein